MSSNNGVLTFTTMYKKKERNTKIVKKNNYDKSKAKMTEKS